MQRSEWTACNNMLFFNYGKKGNYFSIGSVSPNVRFDRPLAVLRTVPLLACSRGSDGGDRAKN